MLIKISTPQDLGLIISAARKHQRLRMDDVAGSAGVGPVFVREVERGKPTVQLGRVMQLMAELGVDLRVDVPAEVVPVFDALKQTGVKLLKPRKIAGTAEAPPKASPKAPHDDLEADKP